MPVAVMDVRVMRVAVHQRPVLVKMGVRLMAVPRKIVFMPVMIVMDMRMTVRKRFVLMSMRMTLGEVQPHTRYHQCRGDPEQQTRRFVKHEQRQARADEGGDRKVRAGAGSADVAQRAYEQREADAIAE